MGHLKSTSSFIAVWPKGVTRRGSVQPPKTSIGPLAPKIWASVPDCQSLLCALNFIEFFSYTTDLKFFCPQIADVFQNFTISCPQITR